MELVGPITFLVALIRAPLASGTSTPPLNLSLRDPRTLLALLYIVHYANRAVISPLRSPPRSKAHISIPLAAIFFNLVNGSLLGAYLTSPGAHALLGSSSASSSSAFSRTSFWLGLGLWATGFAGNILHDEVLMNIRRDALKKADNKGSGQKPHYGIPRGYLYRYISYPNYFCEWVEWAGFSLAAAPFPVLSYAGLTTAAPPWLFFFSEVFLMGSRAYRGHLWYHDKFPEYPKERKAVIPFIL